MAAIRKDKLCMHCKRREAALPSILFCKLCQRILRRKAS